MAESKAQLKKRKDQKRKNNEKSDKKRTEKIVGLQLQQTELHLKAAVQKARTILPDGADIKFMSKDELSKVDMKKVQLAIIVTV